MGDPNENCVQASEFALVQAVPFVEWDRKTQTITFKYGNMPESDGSHEYIRVNAPYDDTPAWNNYDYEKAIIDSSFQYFRPTTCRSWFAGSTLTAIDGLKNLHTDEVTDMGLMFWCCRHLRSLDLSGFNTSNVTNMAQMFHDCYDLCTLDLSSFNTSNVTDMSSMFRSCGRLSSLDLSGFNTSNVTDMSFMFYNCINLETLDLSKFNTSNVTNMSEMFRLCCSLDALDLSGFNTSNVTDMGFMFSDCSNLFSLDLSGFNTSDVTNMNSMFSGCSNLRTLDLFRFNTANVTDMSSMFSGCSNLRTLRLSLFDTDNVTNMRSMFSGCRNLRSLDLSGFNTSNVRNMSYMFSDCEKLRSLDLSGLFNTSNVTSMNSMFFRCLSLEALDLYRFNTSNVTDMSSMFFGCNTLTTLNLSGFNTSNVTDMNSMFSYSSNLRTLDLYDFNTLNVTNMGSMFSWCDMLRTIYVGDKFSTSNAGYSSDIFNFCSKLKGAIEYNGDGIDYANYETGYFTKKVGTNGTTIIGAVGKPLTIREDLILDDKATFDLYEDCNVNTASYDRTMKTEWGTLCLPYTLAVTDDLPCSFYTLKDMGDETILLTKVESDTIAAGQPVMIRRTADVSDLTFNNAPNARIVKAPKNAETGNRLMGTFSTMELTDDDSYFLANDEFRRVGDYRPAVTGVKLAQFRAYLQPEATGRASELRIGVSGETNDVETPQVVDQLNNEATEYYDLSGHRIPNLRKGVNIVKTGDKVRKVIIK